MHKNYAYNKEQVEFAITNAKNYLEEWDTLVLATESQRRKHRRLCNPIHFRIFTTFETGKVFGSDALNKGSPENIRELNDSSYLITEHVGDDDTFRFDVSRHPWVTTRASILSIKSWGWSCQHHAIVYYQTSHERYTQYDTQLFEISVGVFCRHCSMHIWRHVVDLPSLEGRPLGDKLKIPNFAGV